MVVVNVTDCPTTEGLAEESTAAIVLALLTVWLSAVDVLVVKSGSLVSGDRNWADASRDRGGAGHHRRPRASQRWHRGGLSGRPRGRAIVAGVALAHPSDSVLGRAFLSNSRWASLGEGKNENDRLLPRLGRGLGVGPSRGRWRPDAPHSRRAAPGHERMVRYVLGHCCLSSNGDAAQETRRPLGFGLGAVRGRPSYLPRGADR